MKRTPSSSKKKGGGSDAQSVASSSSGGGGGDAVAGEIRLAVLFQSRLGAAPGSNICPPSAIHMNAGDMKRIGIINGTLVRVYIESTSTHLALFAFAALRGGGQPGAAVLSRVWSPNFKGEDRSVTVYRDSGRTTMGPCESISMRVVEGSVEDTSSSLFTTYLKGTLSETTLAVGNVVLLPWKLSSIALRVEKMQVSRPAQAIVNIGDGGEDGDDDILGVAHKFHRGAVTADTYVTFGIVNNEEPKDLSAAFSRLSMVDEERSPSLNSSSASCELPGFGGYAKAVREAMDVTRRGLQSRSSSSYADSASTGVRGVFKPPRGLLIHGPPGTGKSTMMRKIASQLNVSQEEIDHSVLLSRLAGEAESELRQVFLRASKRAPCIVLIDDVEKVSPQRSGGSDDVVVSDLQKRITSCLLNILDGASALDGVFVIATSSHPSSIDPAMRRPGRLERELEMSVPSAAEREDILRQILLSFGVPTGDEQNSANTISSKCLTQASQKTYGMVAADLLLGVKEAYVSATKRSLGGTVDAITALPMPSESPALGTSLRDEDLLAGLDRVVPSAIREVAVDVPTVRWTDIGGMAQVKENLREVVEWPLKYPELFRGMNLPPPRGVLLYGPPGCSKTLMAKALATESGMNFLAVRGPELLSKWLGDSEKAIQTLFRRARAVAPSIVFFDEIDALATRRSTGSAGVNERVLSQLLTELDGGGRDNSSSSLFSSRVIVVAATNRPDMLDDALMRPGRIDRKIYVPPPDAGSRLQILEGQLRKIPCAPDVSYPDLVERTKGFSGAEVVAVCNEAALAAIEEGGEAVAAAHLLGAVAATKPQITPDVISFYEQFNKMHNIV